MPPLDNSRPTATCIRKRTPMNQRHDSASSRARSSRIWSASSRPPASPSTCTKRPTAVTELLAVVRHLSTVPPHEDGDRGMTRTEYAIYCRGYWRALVAALASMDLCLRTRARALRERRQASRLRAVAAAAAARGARAGDGVEVRAGVDRGGSRVRKRRDQVIGDVVAVIALRQPVVDHDGRDVGVGVVETLDASLSKQDHISHSATVTAPVAALQPQDIGAALSRSICDAPHASQASSSGQRSIRYVPEVSSSCPEKVNAKRVRRRAR